MKRLNVVCALLLLAVATWAMPAKRVWRTLTLADGTQLEAQLMGDECFHYWQTQDGRILTACADGLYQLASAPSPEPTRVQMRRQENDRRRAIRRSKISNIRGKKNGLVILVNFTDQQMVHVQEDIHAMMNEVGYHENNHVGSLSDYFYDQSYGQLSIDFDVVGPFMLAHDMKYYGDDNGSEGDDKRPGDMITEAVHLADEAGVDFSKYDWDGDGKVDQVFVIYAGYAQSMGAPSYTIWPHEWDLSSAKALGCGGQGSIRVDGVVVNVYACSSELNNTSGTTLAGIGTAAHEFSHCLGMPDFYDTGTSRSPGMGSWSLMDYGGYNVNCSVPCAYTSFERWYCGWMQPVELDEGEDIVNMKPISEVPEAYIVYNKADRNEFYLLENHQGTHQSDEYRAWDSGTPGGAHGMLVLHVDYDSATWAGNKVNQQKNHQRMTIVPANNKHTYNIVTSNIIGNPYPGTLGVTALTNSTTPAARLYNPNDDDTYFLNRPIENIAEQDGLISFRFNGGGATSVVLPQADAEASLIYNLSGQPVLRPQRGVYIQQGKKVVVK